MSGTSATYPMAASWSPICLIVSRAPPASGKTSTPGHGPVSKKADLLTYRNNAETMRTRVQTLIRQGKKQDDVAKFMTAEYKWAPDSLNMQWSLPGMMTELK